MTTYVQSGVDIDAGERFVKMIRQRIRRAWPEAVKEIGGFAGSVKFKRSQRRALGGVDGSGTVAILCALTERFGTLGQNAAAMSLTDTYVGGGLPVGLLDILDVATLEPDLHIGIIDGLIAGCKSAGSQCRLIGGETAELPNMFRYNWMVNVNTAAVGEPVRGLVTGNVRAGQLVLGWPSNGFGSNGFSLLRNVFALKGSPSQAIRRLDRTWSELGEPLADALLQPAPIWISEAEKQREGGVRFAGHAHVTGGGLVDNIPRILPTHLKVVLDRSTWTRPPIFWLTQRVGKVASNEMDRVFNQGLMMVSIVSNSGRSPALDIPRVIGQVEKRKVREPQVVFTGRFQQ